MISLKLRPLGVLVLLALAQSGWASNSDATAEKLETALAQATLGPGQDADIGGAVIYTYEPDVHYRVFTKPRHVTDIQLEPGEELTGEIAAGDTARWQVAISQSGSGAEVVTHLQIKPLRTNIATNFVVTTNRRSYALLVESGPRAFMPLVRFRYGTGIQGVAESVPAPIIKPIVPDLSTLRFDYTIKAKRRDRDWAPMAAFHDGTRTYVQFADLSSIDAPVVFAVKDKQEALVNYRVTGDTYVIDEVADALVLKQGKKRKIRVLRKRVASR